MLTDVWREAGDVDRLPHRPAEIRGQWPGLKLYRSERRGWRLARLQRLGQTASEPATSAAREPHHPGMIHRVFC